MNSSNLKIKLAEVFQPCINIMSKEDGKYKIGTIFHEETTGDINCHIRGLGTVVKQKSELYQAFYTKDGEDFIFNESPIIIQEVIEFIETDEPTMEALTGEETKQEKELKISDHAEPYYKYLRMKRNLNRRNIIHKNGMLSFSREKDFNINEIGIMIKMCGQMHGSTENIADEFIEKMKILGLKLDWI